MYLTVKRIRVELDTAWVRAVGVSLAAPHVAETARLVLNRANALTPVRTGNLRAKNTMVMRARRTYVAGRIQNNAKYALPVHQGSAPHRITARRRKSLKFPMTGMMLFAAMIRGPVKNGGNMFVRSVWHPGSPGRPWLTDALSEVAYSRGYDVSIARGVFPTAMLEYE